MRKGADLDAIAKAIPSVPLNEMLDHRFEGHAMQGIDGTRLSHGRGRRRELSVRMSRESSGVMHERTLACGSGACAALMRRTSARGTRYGTAPTMLTRPDMQAARKIGTKGDSERHGIRREGSVQHHSETAANVIQRAVGPMRIEGAVPGRISNSR